MNDVTVWLDGQPLAPYDADPVLAGLVGEALRLMARRGLTYFGVRAVPTPAAGSEIVSTRRAALDVRHHVERQVFEAEVARARQQAAMDAQAAQLGGVEDLALPEVPEP